MPEPAPVPPAPAPAPAPKPAPVAPGFGELLELSFAGVVNPSTYRALAARPAPGFGTAIGLSMAAGAASLFVNLAHGIIADPKMLSGYSPLLIAAVGVAAMGLYGSVMLLLSVMMYGLGNALGGTGTFDRGLQAAAMMSILWPVQMMCNWFPVAWVIPSALAAWIAACSLEGLIASKPTATRIVCAVFGLGALGIQTVGHMVADRAHEAVAAAGAMTQTAGAQADLSQQIQAIQAQAMQAAATGVPMTTPTVNTVPAQVSSLDLLRGPGPDADAPQAQTPEAAPEQAAMQAAQGMKTNVVGMLDSVAPLLSNPLISKNFTPAQKADMKELQDLMAQLRSQATAGHSLSDAEFAKRMQRFQALTMRMMAAAAAAPPPAAAQKTTPHLKLPEPK